MRQPGSVLVGVGSLFVVAALPAQLQWTRVGLDERFQHAMVSDPVRNRVLLFGGAAGEAFTGDTHEWSGGAWTQRFPAHQPPGRRNAGLAYDVPRGRAVLFGGRTTGYALNDTWEWDGFDWTERQVSPRPSAREQHAMAYDAARGELVLFGGAGTGGVSSETWVWDGTAWSPRFPVTWPTARMGHAMAFDQARGQVVLFGGMTGSYAFLGDTWLWDGTNWTQAATTGPSPRVTAISDDPLRRRVVLFGGQSATGSSNDTWEWDGNAWQLVTVTAPPPARWAHALAFDPARNRTVLFGGVRGTDPDGWSDTWEWDGVAWTRIVATNNPLPRGRHAMAYDPIRQRTVVFGGFGNLVPGGAHDDTWTWDGSHWSDRTPAAGNPPRRFWHMMATDPARGRVVIFGGAAPAGTPLNDTWEWDGTSWAQSFPTQSPRASSQQSMVWDGARQRVFLFNCDASSRENWEWDGIGWTRVPSVAAPNLSGGHAMAFDPLRGNVVLFGGIGPGGRSAQTWTWDGTNWALQSPPRSPSARAGALMAFDPVLGRVVLFGGTDQVSVPRQLSDVWDWDGFTWTVRTPPPGPRPRQETAMVYDAARQRLVLFGGNYGPAWLADTWELAPASPASYQDFGRACASSAGFPRLGPVALQRPWLGDLIELELSGTAATQLAVLWSGYSRTSFGSLVLPFDMGPIGAPGCLLLASGQIAMPMPFSGNVHRATFVLPTDAALAGASFYQQALVLASGANPLGLVVSQGLAGRCGRR